MIGGSKLKRILLCPVRLHEWAHYRLDGKDYDICLNCDKERKSRQNWQVRIKEIKSKAFG